MTFGGLDLMNKTWRRTIARPSFWGATALQGLMASQLFVAVGAVLNPETTFRGQVWPSGAIYAVTITVFLFFFPLFTPDTVKNPDNLSDEQSATIELALRTGTLPAASLFADWGPALERRRRGLAVGRWVLPVLMAGCIALNVYDSVIDPSGAWFYWISAVLYAVMAVTGEVGIRRRARRIRALNHQLEKFREGERHDA